MKNSANPANPGILIILILTIAFFGCKEDKTAKGETADAKDDALISETETPAKSAGEILAQADMQVEFSEDFIIISTMSKGEFTNKEIQGLILKINGIAAFINGSERNGVYTYYCANNLTPGATYDIQLISDSPQKNAKVSLTMPLVTDIDNSKTSLDTNLSVSDKVVFSVENFAAKAEDYEKVTLEDSVIDSVFQFMRSKLGLDEEQRAVDLIRNWQWSGSWQDYYKYRKQEALSEDSNSSNNEEDYYTIIEKSQKSGGILEAIAAYYAQNKNKKGSFPSQKKLESSGAKDCIRVLLWAYGDIYSKKNRDEILTDIYRIMEQKQRYSGDDIYYYPKNYYDDLRQYMSDGTLDKIDEINSNGNVEDMEWANTTLAAWSYSFWGRRHHDNVDNAAYKLLKVIGKLYL